MVLLLESGGWYSAIAVHIRSLLTLLQCQRKHWTEEHKTECKLWAGGKMREIKKLRDAKEAAAPSKTKIISITLPF